MCVCVCVCVCLCVCAYVGACVCTHVCIYGPDEYDTVLYISMVTVIKMNVKLIQSVVSFYLSRLI